MVDLAEQYAKVYFWVIIDPHETETFAQAADLLQHPKALGVKIHPEEHEYSLLELGDKLFAFAAKHHAPLLGHSGAECCMPEIYSFFAEQYPEIPVIAAHLGSSFDADPNHHIRSILNNQTGNLYTDMMKKPVLQHILSAKKQRRTYEYIMCRFCQGKCNAPTWNFYAWLLYPPLRAGGPG